jgi:predicted DCC family thiol-disulfide oxidoreductase YuxK
MEPTSPRRPIVIFDGDCGFCRACIDYGRRLTGESVDYAPYQEVSAQFPRIRREEFAQAVKLVLPTGEIRSGAEAVFSAVAGVPGYGWILQAYDYLPGVAFVSEAVYGVIARHRSAAYTLSKLLWGLPLKPESFRAASWLFLRLLGLIYFIAFLSLGVQSKGLIGSHGILPVGDFLHAVREYYGAARFWNVPTVLWFSSSDAALRAVWVGGACLSALLFLGIEWRALRFALFALYLSLDVAGQVFMTYQWDALLLEAGFLAIFLGSSPTVVRLFRWLLFRLMFLSGSVKLLSGDPAWRGFTALPVHYETQPLPTPLAWYFYQAPGWFQRFSIGFVFFVELLIPFFVLAPRRIRVIAAWCIILLQVLIGLTGNYAFFNLLTIALCLFLLDDSQLSRIIPGNVMPRICSWFHESRYAAWRRRPIAALAAFILLVSGYQMAREFSGLSWMPADAITNAIAPFEIIHTYGLFAVMTTTRPEIIIEGSNDAQNWQPYEFKYKMGDLGRRPRWVAPHQPRLDWQMWFAALGNYRSDPWILQFMLRLLEGSPDVLRLMQADPFHGAPPRYIRATTWLYRFTTPAERKATGDWWKREPQGVYVPPVSLRGP